MTDPATQLGITSAAIAGDAGSLYRIVSHLMEEGADLDSVLFDHLIPAERGLGDRWQSGDYSVAEEHAATATIETVVSLLSGMFDQPPEGRQVVVASVQGDGHSLPGRALSASLLYNGYRTTFLGSNVVASDLGSFLEAEGSDLAILSCAMTAHLMGAYESIAAAREAGVPVIAGGNAFGADGGRALKMGANAWASDLREAISLVDQQLSSPRPPAPLPEVGSELADLIDRTPALAAEAFSRIDRESDSGFDGRWLDEIDILLGSIQAAMLLSDDSIVRDVVAWQRHILEVHGYSPTAVTSALHSALETSSPAAAELLYAALATG